MKQSKNLIKKEPTIIFKLWNYFLSLLFDGIQNASSNSKAIDLAPAIGEYSLVKRISQNRYATALYKSKKGKKIIAKVWQGKRKNLAYFALRHEALASEILTNAIKREGKKMPTYFRSIKVARFIGTIEQDNSLILLTHFAEGKPLADKQYKDSILNYDLCVNFLRYLGAQLTPKERKLITEKTILDFLILLPGIAIVSIIKQPHLIPKILLGLLVFLPSIPALFANKKQVLIHGDLHVGNMLIDGRKITLVDLEQTYFTYPQYEYISTMLCATSRGELAEEISKRMDKESKQDISSAAFLSGLIAFRSLHYLTGNTSRFNINLYSKILSFGNVLLQRFAVNRMSKLDFGIRLNILLFDR